MRLLHDLLLKPFLLCPPEVPLLILLCLLKHLHGLKLHLYSVLLLLFLDLHNLDPGILLLAPFLDDEAPGLGQLLLTLLHPVSVHLLLLQFVFQHQTRFVLCFLDLFQSSFLLRLQEGYPIVKLFHVHFFQFSDFPSLNYRVN